MLWLDLFSEPCTLTMKNCPSFSKWIPNHYHSNTCVSVRSVNKHLSTGKHDYNVFSGNWIIFVPFSYPIAREQDGIDLRGFYVWNLQDRHTFHFGLFAPTHHESHPKGSVKAYREIISHRGFPSGDRGTQRSCQLPIAQAYSCFLCTKISENKPLLFFGICVFISFVVLAAVLVGLLRRKLCMGGRRRAANPMSPQRITKQRWERFAMQRVVRRMWRTDSYVCTAFLRSPSHADEWV